MPGRATVKEKGIKRYLYIFGGNLLITGAYAFITVPNEIINGGVTSFSMVLQKIFNMDISFFVNLISLILLLLCYIFLGKDFFIGSVFSCISYLIQFTFFHSMNLRLELPLLVCVFIAGIAVGIGYFFCIRAESTAISFDVVALILNKKFPVLNIAYTIGAINLLVLLAGFTVYGILSIVYGVIFTFIQTFTLKELQKRLKE